mgnify:CR=1 FL=1
MLTENKDKPLAIIHVDVDCLWTIKQDLGQIINRKDCITYGEAIPRFLEIFDKEAKSKKISPNANENNPITNRMDPNIFFLISI